MFSPVKNASILRRSLVVTIAIACAAAPAAAQGRGKAKGGRSGPATTGTAAPVATSVTSGAGVRQFGSWLDDASVLTPGDAWTSISLGHYRSLGGRQTDFPVIDAGIGVTPRTQFGISLPYYRMHFVDGTNLAGFGDVFLSGKIALVDPSNGKHTVGFSVSPVVEIANDPMPGMSRFSWGAPINVEFRATRYRVFGSSGYFSRGAIFGSGAIEVPLSERLIVTSALTHTRSIKEDLTADALGLAKSRSDVTASAAFFVTETMAAFVGTGRTLSNADGTGTTFMLTGGISFTFAPRLVAP
jgi:hypothetical protein